MNYNVKGTNVPVTDELRSYLEKRLGSLDKFLHSDASRADVEVEYLESEGKQYRAELMVYDKDTHRAVAKGSSLHEAIDIAAAELFQELTRSKKKRLHRFRHSAVRVKEYLRGWRNKI